MNYYIGIDLGTSSCKGSVVDSCGRVYGTHSVKYAVSCPAPNFSEQDPADWYNAAVEILKALSSGIEDDIKGVSIAGAIALWLDWRLILILVAVFLIAAFLSKRVSVGSLCAGLAYPVAMFILGGFAWHQLALAFFILVLVFFTHRANIGRIIKGTEPEFRAGRGKK